MVFNATNPEPHFHQLLPNESTTTAPRPSESDVKLADEVAWTMSLEGRELSPEAYGQLLEKIVANRLTQGPDADVSQTD